jgi:hypothetical protein
MKTTYIEGRYNFFREKEIKPAFSFNLTKSEAKAVLNLQRKGLFPILGIYRVDFAGYPV